MDPRDLGFITQATQGELRNASPRERVTGISTDSRKIKAGDLFIALVGDRFDAHDFLSPELGKKASACLVESSRVGERLGGLPQIIVPDSRRALGSLGAEYRRQFDLPVIGVTGSNGKTSTKRFLRTILGKEFNTCASPASFNNDIGVPLSLLDLDERMAAAVFEIGTNHPGEIEPLARMVAPNIGVLTSIGRSHLEFFGTPEAVAYEKGFLGASLPVDGLFVVNGDASHLDLILPRVDAKVTKVGFGPENDWIISRWRMDRKGMVFTLQAAGSDVVREFCAPVFGKHHLVNLGLSIVVGEALGMSDEALKQGVAECQPERMRFQPRQVGGVTILDDTYNANLDSMTAALETLCAYPVSGSHVAVLGEMGELGEHSRESHRELGRVAARSGVGQVVALGAWAEEVVEGAKENGLEQVAGFAESRDALQFLMENLKYDDAVLFKASRSAGLDNMVREIIEGLGNEPRLEQLSGRIEKRDNFVSPDLNRAANELKVGAISVPCRFEEETQWQVPFEVIG